MTTRRTRSRSQRLRPLSCAIFRHCRYGLLLALAANSAQAQQIVLEEIIVTAQKRDENVQDVPITMNALSATQLREIGAQNISDLGVFTPGLETNNTSDTQPKYNIRGITTDDFGIGADPAVAVYIDGVYVGRGGSSQLNFNDVQAVEVLKGPQGTLFGRNAAAGAISITTVKPHEETEGRIGVTAGNYNKRRIEGMFNTALTDHLFFRTSALVNKRDGFIDNDFTGEKLGQEDNWSINTALLWRPADGTEIIWRAEYDEIDHDAPHAISMNPTIAPADPFDDVQNDSPSFETRELFGTSLTINHHFEPYTFTSITSYRTFNSDNREDEDGSANFNVYFDTWNIEKNKQFSQEFRLLSESDGPLTWFVGANYFREHGKQTHRTILSSNAVDLQLQAAGLGTGLPGSGLEDANNFVSILGLGFGPGTPGATLLGRFFTENFYDDLVFESAAIFGEARYEITPDLALTLGLRYTRDSKEFERSTGVNEFGYPIAFNFPGAPLSTLNPADWQALSASEKLDDSWSRVTPRAVLDYHITRDAMIYVSAAQGFKAGGYNSTTFGTPAFDEEIVDNYELGIKSNWLDHRLRINAAVYYYEYQDLQIQEFYAPQGQTISQYLQANADAEGKGFELEVDWAINDYWAVGLNAAIMKTEYTDFTQKALNPAESRDRSGDPISGMPEKSYTALVKYLQPLGNGDRIEVRVDWSYVSERESIEDPVGYLDFTTGTFSAPLDNRIDSYDLTNLRISYLPADGNWLVSAWVNNLLDEEYLYSRSGGLGSEVGSPASRRGEPRLYGVDLTWKF